MKTAAAITALAVAGSFALGQGAKLPVASDSPSSLVSNSPPMRGLPVRPTGDLPAPHGSLQLGADCPPVEVEEWFAHTPRLAQCLRENGNIGPNFACQPIWSADVNADGQQDYTKAFLTALIVYEGQPRYEPEFAHALYASRTVPIGSGEVRITSVQIPAFRETLGAWCIANLSPSGGTFNTAVISIEGWRDMDGDGDLDLCCFVGASVSGGGDPVFRNYLVWYENIGYEKSPPPLAADLNHDGDVDGVDLGILLAAWGT